MLRVLLIVGFLSIPSWVYSQPNSPCPSANYQPILSNNTGTSFLICEAGVWVELDLGGGSGLPADLIVLTLTTCPSGYVEATELEGVALIGTVAANKNVGTSIGSNTITPTGTVSQPTFTGDAFTAVINHTHPITDPGHSHTQASTTIATGSTANRLGTNDTSSTAVNTGTTTTGVTTNNPAGGVASITPTGTVSTPIFTGNQFDNRPASKYVIFCKKS